ncbi:MAG: hypothetical protein HYR90_02230 [Candidatus Andersenbacteria bacterium]|nr:hypothetical protein [Candidatus Andersenbacteria bacterium]MBI3250977.1 hypothetical protein [Candidatus Andersenbacteria bacterium]
MGIESEPKITPEENDTPSDSQKPEKSTGSTDWSRIEKRIAKQAAKDTSADQRISRVNNSENHTQIIREQEYQKIKDEMARFRTEHGIQKTKEELEEEDLKLRQKFGLE